MGKEKKTYEFTLLEKKNPYENIFIIKKFYHVAKAAELIGVSTTTLQVKIERKTIEHVRITDWNRKDTVNRAMIDNQVIAWEKEKRLAKTENREPEAPCYDAVKLTVKLPEIDLFYIIPEISYQEMADIALRYYREYKIEVEHSKEESKVITAKKMNKIGEIFTKDGYILNGIPYEKLSYSIRNLDKGDPFDIYYIYHVPNGQGWVRAVNEEEWLNMKKKVIKAKNPNILDIESMQKVLDCARELWQDSPDTGND